MRHDLGAGCLARAVRSHVALVEGAEVMVRESAPDVQVMVRESALDVARKTSRHDKTSNRHDMTHI